MLEHKKSKFVHTIQNKNFICLHHAITLEDFFITEDYLNIFKKFKEKQSIDNFNNKDRFYIKGLIEKKFLINNSKEDEKIIENLKRVSPKQKYSLLRILMTDSCNLACKYCKVELNLKRKLIKSIEEKDVKNILRQFQKLSPQTKKLVSITGGEPLLDFNKVKKIIELCKKVLKNYWIVLFTNGTLINENIVDYLKKENILLVVSIDGGEKSHNKVRIFKNGQGSYDLIKKGLILLKRKKLKIGISCVVGKHNIDNLYSDFSYIINKFNPQSLGLNPLKYPSINDLSFNLLINPKKYAREVYKIFIIAREKEIFVEQVNRKLLPFVEQKFKFYECGACGGRNINIDAKGNIGPCKSYLVMEKLFQKSSMPIYPSKVFRKLLHRIPLLNENCLNCPSIGICGGGCSYEGFVETEDMFEFSKRNCNLSNEFLKLMISDLFSLNKRNITSNLNKKGYCLIKSPERKKMYGEIKISPGTLRYSVGHI